MTGAGTLGIIPDATRISAEYVPQIYFNILASSASPADHIPAQQHLHGADGFSKVAGKHTFKFGGEFRYLQVNERNLASQDGAFVFDGTVTGVDFADYLLGAQREPGGLHPGCGTTAGFAHALWRRLMCRTHGRQLQSDAEFGSSLGSEYALVRHAGKDPDLG